MSRRLLFALLVSALPACGPDKSDDDDDDDGGDDTAADDTAAEDETAAGSGGGDEGGGEDGTETCEGTAPDIVSITCQDGGVVPHFETGEDTATLQLAIDVEDDDGDLHQYQVSLFLDEDIDGSVAEADSPYSPVNQSLDLDECDATATRIELTLYLNGERPAYDTRYEWLAVVTDANGLSDGMIWTCRTPPAP